MLDVNLVFFFGQVCFFDPGFQSILSVLWSLISFNVFLAS